MEVEAKDCLLINNPQQVLKNSLTVPQLGKDFSHEINRNHRKTDHESSFTNRFEIAPDSRRNFLVKVDKGHYSRVWASLVQDAKLLTEAC